MSLPYKIYRVEGHGIKNISPIRFLLPESHDTVHFSVLSNVARLNLCPLAMMFAKVTELGRGIM